MNKVTTCLCIIYNPKDTKKKMEALNKKAINYYKNNAEMINGGNFYLSRDDVKDIFGAHAYETIFKANARRVIFCHTYKIMKGFEGIEDVSCALRNLGIETYFHKF